MAIAVLVKTSVGPTHRLHIALMPITSLVLLALPVGIVISTTNWRPAPSTFWICWAALSVLLLAWGILKDPELLNFTLTDQDLRRGKRAVKVVFRFDEIEEIVVGWKAQFPWYLGWMKYHPSSRVALDIRSETILVRLSDGQRFPLNLATGQFQNGLHLMRKFIELNTAKIVPRETYSAKELERLKRVDLNRIFSV